MNDLAETMGYLHSRGLDLDPKGLAAALKTVIDSLQALYYPKPGQEGLTAEEIRVSRKGGLDPRPVADDRPDPLLSGVMAYAGLVSTGLTTLQAAKRLAVTDARIRQRLQQKTLMGIRAGRSWKLPIFQFAGEGELPGWGEVCSRLPEGVSPVVVERWLTLAHPDLVAGEDESPMSPRQWLLDGRPAREVAGLVDELA